MSTFGDFMIDQAVKKDAEVDRLRTSNREILEALEDLIDTAAEAMKEANNDGAEWDEEEALRLAKAAIQKARGA